jgi:hypothetical protein
VDKNKPVANTPNLFDLISSEYRKPDKNAVFVKPVRLPVRSPYTSPKVMIVILLMILV